MTKSDTTFVAMLAVATGWLLGGCGSLLPPDPNILLDKNGQPVNTDAVAAIFYDPQYANEDAKRAALEALGLSTESAQYCLDHPEKVIGVSATAFEVEIWLDRYASPRVVVWNQADATTSLEVTLWKVTTGDTLTHTWSAAPGESVSLIVPQGRYFFSLSRNGEMFYAERPWFQLGYLYRWGKPPS